MYRLNLFIYISHICRWSVKDKALALSLYHSSPKTYRMLQKVITRIFIIFSKLIILHVVIYLIIIITLFIKLFKLPSSSTLHRSMNNIVIYPGFSSHILNALKIYIYIYIYNMSLYFKLFN